MLCYVLVCYVMSYYIISYYIPRHVGRGQGRRGARLHARRRPAQPLDHGQVLHVARVAPRPNFCQLDFGGFDSSIILISRWNSHVHGEFPGNIESTKFK